MKPPSLNRIAALLALLAGGMDFCTGLGLMLAPSLTLGAMMVPIPSGDGLTYLRFVGAFVAAVGASYLLGLASWKSSGSPALLRSVFVITILFRASAGIFSGVAILSNLLPTAWTSVPITDLALVAVQFWLLRKGALQIPQERSV